MRGVGSDRASDLGVADVSVAVEHPYRGPAGQELNRPRIDAVLEHQGDAGVPHRVVTRVGNANRLERSDHPVAGGLLRWWFAIVAFADDVAGPLVAASQ